jgi:hypothetical protein
MVSWLIESAAAKIVLKFRLHVPYVDALHTLGAAIDAKASSNAALLIRTPRQSCA